MAVTKNELSLYATTYTFHARKNSRVFLIEVAQDIVGNGQVFRMWKLYERGGLAWDKETMSFASYPNKTYKSQFNNLDCAVEALMGYCERNDLTLTT